ncbi:MarR family winged helix-turn-helix transcriptional regulator [Parafilimonas terrae]|uniref:DNA-binding transcriptional regulator, MarR family n=1 Tax=Parafilimonas terrae TaxID=1465490 RepID=A0A1I5WCJ8_9BACT|nr:MarR family winged helix-turn-helix transcriptional regulator [Parafilimonas terrae]SFQ17398.1 DNA-binding transcriptional regulator, MarR family [Parafilimonas terrae]
MNFYQDLGFLVFGSRLKRLGNTFINDVNRIYKNHKIQFDASWFPVFYILSQKDEVSIKEISNNLKVSHSAISQLASSLQQKGFIKSVISKADARHKNIMLTAKGRKLLEKIKPVWFALEKAMNELAEESGSSSKKILKALTGIETSLSEKDFFDRIESHL